MSISQSIIEYLDRGEGSIAFEAHGAGPLVLCVPGMGDIRSSYRFLVPPLVAAGYRVVVADLRGHGDSDATFSRYDDAATADDMVALIEHLASPATIVGNSMAAGAAVIAAVARPELVTGLVLLGPFVRNPPSNPVLAAVFRALTAPPIAAFIWKRFLPSLYAGHKPADFQDYLNDLHAAMTRKGHRTAFWRTAQTSHAPAEAVADQVRCPTLIVMGKLDPDFANAHAEAQWVADQTAGEILMVDNCGHYPQSQRPDEVAPAIVAFLSKARHA
jgi:pimeloyl-ACP methyl ester carboxylesterase